MFNLKRCLEKLIRPIKDWMWERWHAKLHYKLALLFSLTEEQRKKLWSVWMPKARQVAVYIDEDSKKEWEYHQPAFNWPEEYKAKMIWFDSDGRYIKNNYFPDKLFYCTFFIDRTDGEKLYWYKEYYYNKQDCLPVLSKRKLKMMEEI